MVNILINRKNKIIFFLALMNSAHLSIDVHCSNGAKIKIDLTPLLQLDFSVLRAKI